MKAPRLGAVQFSIRRHDQASVGGHCTARSRAAALKCWHRAARAARVLQGGARVGRRSSLQTAPTGWLQGRGRKCWAGRFVRTRQSELCTMAAARAGFGLPSVCGGGVQRLCAAGRARTNNGNLEPGRRKVGHVAAGTSNCALAWRGFAHRGERTPSGRVQRAVLYSIRLQGQASVGGTVQCGARPGGRQAGGRRRAARGACACCKAARGWAAGHLCLRTAAAELHRPRPQLLGGPRRAYYFAIEACAAAALRVSCGLSGPSSSVGGP